jgi:hypothetical protein
MMDSSTTAKECIEESRWRSRGLQARQVQKLPASDAGLLTELIVYAVNNQN